MYINKWDWHPLPIVVGSSALHMGMKPAMHYLPISRTPARESKYSSRKGVQDFERQM